MSSNQLSDSEKEVKFGEIRERLSQERRASIKDDIRGFVMALAVGDDHASALDIAFRIEKLPVVASALRELAAELEEAHAKK